MIVQITQVRDELVLLKELLPVWKNYVDGFVFFADTTTDGTLEYLKEMKEEYNILEVLEYTEKDSVLKIETDNRQLLFDAARKYSDKIICLDADEYLDGEMTKKELEQLLDDTVNTVFYLQWMQYTSNNTIRVDGPWKNNFKDRIGSYVGDCQFVPMQMHSTHLPIPQNEQIIDPSKLFIAHLQWLDKNHVAIKQYFWKVTDYVNKKLHGANVAGTTAYDTSVNNFEWEEEYIDYQLKIREDVFEDTPNSKNYRVDWIREQTKKHSIPNLGDWGLNIHNSIPMYFCTAADDKHYPILLNMIGSIHKHNYYDVEEMAVYDLGLSDKHLQELRNLKKVRVYNIEEVNPEILTNIETGINRSVKGLFSWKPVAIKDSLDRYPYVLYLDAGTTILKPLNDLFKHIAQNGYLLFDCGHSIKQMATKYLIDKFALRSDNDAWILDDDILGIDAGFQGVSRELYDSFVLPMYELAKDIQNFTDDGTCPKGWGYGRHDQTLYSILAQQLKLDIQYHDNKDRESNLTIDGTKQKFHITHTPQWITPNTTVFRSRWNISYESYKDYVGSIKRRYTATCITAIGNLATYERFIDRYFANIQEQVNFKRIEFLIVYSQWSAKFEAYKSFSNIRFIKENEQLGVYNAWNIGIEHATAEFISNWNIDDIRFGINTSIKSTYLQKNVEVDLAYNYYTATTEDKLDSLDPNNLPYIPYPDNFHTVAKSMCMAGPDPLWRKSTHLFLGLFNYQNYSIIGDWEMWIRMASKGFVFRLIPYVLSIYVDHSDTVSKSDDVKVQEQKIELQQQYK